MTLYTIGYGLWPTARRMESLIEALRNAEVRLLIDTRHSPCSSQLDPNSHYGPRNWHLQLGGHGLESELKKNGIDYRWLVELGNPQINDKAMRVLREQLASGDDRWPVNRGLKLLVQLLQTTGPCALLCACADWRKCHRILIAEVAHERFPDLQLAISHLPGGPTNNPGE